MRQENEGHFLFGTVILGLLSVFKKSQASSPYESFHSVCLSRGHRDVRPPIQMTLTPTAFFRFYTWDSDMSSSCEMKDEPEFMPLQGNRAFFGVRAFRGPFHLRQKTQGPSHITTAGGKLLLRSCGKLAHLFSQSRGIRSHPGTIWGAWRFPRVAVLKLIFI